MLLPIILLDIAFICSFVVTVLACYYIVAANKESSSLWMLICHAGSKPSTRSVFRNGFMFSSLLLTSLLFFEHVEASHYIESTWCKWLNVLSCLLGLLTALCMCLMGYYDVQEHNRPHNYAAAGFTLFGLLYQVVFAVVCHLGDVVAGEVVVWRACCAAGTFICCCFLATFIGQNDDWMYETIPQHQSEQDIESVESTDVCNSPHDEEIDVVKASRTPWLYKAWVSLQFLAISFSLLYYISFLHQFSFADNLVK